MLTVAETNICQGLAAGGRGRWEGVRGGEGGGRWEGVREMGRGESGRRRKKKGVRKERHLLL